MYNLQLETFMMVVDQGSFSKAAEKLYISPTAVIKQINLLEENTGLILFKRTHRGILLTKAGESFYKDTKYLIQYAKDSIERAKQATKQEESVIRVGTSITTPSQCILSILSKLDNEQERFKLRFVSFENTPENAIGILRNLGNHIDIVAGTYSENFLKERQCQALKISEEPICVAVSIYHPLANKEYLEITDLYDQTLMIPKTGWNEYIDVLKQDIQVQHPSVHMEEVSFYNLETFNRCEASQNLLIAFSYWGLAHPLLKILPVRWNYTIPFGIMYSLQPTSTVLDFIDTLGQIYKV